MVKSMRKGIVLVLGICIASSCQLMPPKKVETFANNERAMLATLWYRKAAETRALMYQAFNIAKLRLDAAVKERRGKSSKKFAVVVDIDETILDNSPYQAQAILENYSYPTGWVEWIRKEEAQLIPGAKSFLQYADNLGVEVIYISNRKMPQFDATLRNLQAHALPVKASNIFLRKKKSSKVPRREKVSQEYEILLLIGDNLGDFSGVFDHQSVSERFSATDEMAALFGKKFIVLPNPMYGEWEGALYDYQWGKSAEEKDADRRAGLL